MALEPLYSLEEGADKLETYPTLLANILDEHDIAYRTIGKKRQIRVLNDDAIEQARPHVLAWINRPRMSKRQAAATA